ncbi:MAG: DUF4142 domain-containing protein [Armatimonadetes bacterium]|nr:DUF4142 domain-containing protein [Armatimonadota bacterium]
MKNRFQLGALGAALLVTGSLAAPSAQAQNNMMMPDPAPLNAAITANFDRIFMIHAAQTNMAEVMMGSLALRRSNNPGVRMIARTTMRDHARAQRDLASHFRAMDAPLPPNPGPIHTAVYEKLSRLRGAAFDKAYMAVQVGAHEGSVTLYAHEIENGRNATAKAHAQNKLPHILGHTAMIYDVARRVGAPGVNLRPPAVVQAAMQSLSRMQQM